tara:strand:+ start:7718 stop:7939 length:222 start_codon:yes stop_codon:yes gene_type:complete
MRKVTQDIKMVYQISDIDEILLWDKLVIELERKEHSLESIKETDEFLALSQSFVVHDKMLEKLIKIHLDSHEF